MSSNINMVCMTGLVEGTVTLKQSQAGKPFAKCVFVSTRLVREQAEDATVECVAFGGVAEKLAAHANFPLFVAGRLKTERWEWQGKACKKLILQLEEVRPLADGVPSADAVHADEAVAPKPVPRAPAPAPAGNDDPPF